MLSVHWLPRYPSNWEPRISRKFRHRTRSPVLPAHRWKFRPSSLTTTQQCGKQVSSASKSRTYSNLLLAMVTPNLRHRLKVTEVAAKRLRISAALKGHIPHGEALDGPHPGSSCRCRSRSSYSGGFSLDSPSSSQQVARTVSSRAVSLPPSFNKSLSRSHQTLFCDQV